MSYVLVSEMMITEGAIRSLSTGCDDEILCGSQANSPNVRRFKITAQAMDALPEFEEVGEAIVHDHWIMAVTSLKPGMNASYPDGVFITGCQDSNIRVFNPNTQELLFKIEGHTKPVVSLSWTANGKLVSGSWDGTARIWDLELGGACLMELTGHENAVAVLGLSNGALLTTSTGENVNGKPANFSLRVWDPVTGKQQGASIEHHAGSIRDVKAVPGLPNGFATTSNDGSVRVYSVDESGAGAMAVSGGGGGGEGNGSGAVMSAADVVPGAVYYHPVGSDNSPTFVLGCSGLPNDATDNSSSSSNAIGSIISYDMDGGVLVSDAFSGERQQLIPHPNTVWCALAVPGTDGDFLTGCQDGTLRLFSKNSLFVGDERVARLQQAFETAYAASQEKKQNGPSSEELSKYPKWTDRASHSDRSEGTVMVFSKDNKAIAAQYTSGNWIELGEVTGKSSGDSGSVHGVQYDHVMPVEMGAPGGGVVTYQLGFNDAENPFIAAQRFLDQNELDQQFHSQVADWITERGGSGGNAGPTIGGGGAGEPAPGGLTGDVSRAPPAPPAAAATTGGAAAYSFPLRGYLSHGELPPVDKLLAKIHALNAEQEPTAQLSETAVAALGDLLSTLRNTSMYHSSTVTAAQLKPALAITTQWRVKDSFPGYDILRLVCLHPSGAASLASSPAVATLLGSALDMISDTATNSSVSSDVDATKLTCLKLINNSFKCDEMRGALARHGGFTSGGGGGGDEGWLHRLLSITQTLGLGAAALSKSMRAGAGLLLANLTVASFSSPEARSLVFNTPYLYSLLQSCYTALAAEPAEPSGKGSPDTVFVLLNSIGTVATYPELGADLVTKAKSGTADTGVAQASDVLAIVQASWGAKLGQAALQGLSEVQALFR